MSAFQALYGGIAQPVMPTRHSVKATSPVMATALTPNWDARKFNPGGQPVIPEHGPSYYAQCMLGGILSCGLTHAAVCPLDVVKCNMQNYPEKYKSLGQGLKLVMAEEGSMAIWKGVVPTFFGYAAQGFCKFGFYEFFKDFYSNMAGEQNAYDYRGLIFLAGSASAEFFADVALCPLEMVKVKIQTTPHEENFPKAMGPAIAKMQADPKISFPFGSVVPLWSRQIPYTMAKFYFFEKVVEFFYSNVFTEPKSSYPKSTQLGVTFASGYIAGVICAIVSHPADTAVSQMGKPENAGKGFFGIISEIGPKKIWMGLGTRIIMIGTLTGLQWWIYDTFKSVMGLGTTGGGAVDPSKN